MKSITLTQGKIAIVDDDMYDYLNQFKWHAHQSRKSWYAMRNAYSKGSHKWVRMHRAVLGCSGNVHVDHINGNGLDNRRENLRVCTTAENAWNSKVYNNNKSGLKGVHWSVKRNRYRAEITSNKTRIHLGYFKDPIEAAKVYDAAARKYHGKFARLNFPD